MADDSNPASRTNSSVQGNEGANSSLKLMEDSLKTIINPQSQLITASRDENSFMLWRFQIETTIRGYGLQDFIDGTTPTPLNSYLIQKEDSSPTLILLLIRDKTAYYVPDFYLPSVQTFSHKLLAAKHHMMFGLQYRKISVSNPQ